MYNNQQFEQLVLQYNQLINGAEDIYKMLQDEDFDSAMTMLKTREAVYLNCKGIRKYLELSKEQETILNEMLDRLKELEKKNIDTLKKMMTSAEDELKASQQNEKFQHAYDFNENHVGTIVNLEE